MFRQFLLVITAFQKIISQSSIMKIIKAGKLDKIFVTFKIELKSSVERFISNPKH